LRKSASSKKLQEFAVDRGVVVFSANRNFSNQFKAVASEEHAVRIYDIASDSNSDSANPLRIAKVMRSNPDSVGVFYVSGRTVAQIASKLDADVTKRMLLVTTEPTALIPNYKEFQDMVDIYARHPELGKLIAEHYFVSAPEAIRQPSATGSFTQDPHESYQSAEHLPEAQ
jgi:hypothetical protein